jgi:hypothetical protein
MEINMIQGLKASAHFSTTFITMSKKILIQVVVVVSVVVTPGIAVDAVIDTDIVLVIAV